MNNENIKKAAEAYDAAGFQVLPLNGKAAAVRGHHGRQGATESVFPKGNQNLAARLSPGLIGIDVDAHSGKDGAEALQRCIDRWGALPPTDKSTSRDGVSGIYWFRVPSVGWEGDEKKFGGDIELISHVNRYAVVPPSIHPKTGDVYRWETVGDTPMWESGPDAFPMLPAKWQEGLRRTNEVGTLAKGAERHEEAVTDGVPCEAVETALAKFTANLEPGKRHPVMTEVQCELVRLGAEGHPGVKTALDTLEGNFLTAVAGESRQGNEWEDALDGALRGAGDVVTGDPCEVAPLVLPAQFWEARPELQHVRAAAHARGSSADVALFALLARYSALVDHRIRVNTGVLSPASLNTYVIVLGGSGVGKSSGVDGAEKLMPTPTNREGLRDGIIMGSGEGAIEAYFGKKWVETERVDKNGKQIWEKPKVQVSSNVFAYVDEGEQLVKTLNREGATLGPILRSMWVGGSVGMQNASEETTRHLPSGSYAFGLVMGFQPSTVEPVLSDSGSGMAQRMLWCAAEDPSIPFERTEHPGPLNGYVLEDDESFVASTPDQLVMHYTEELKDLTYRERVETNRGMRDDIDEYDSHKPLSLAKISGLLALLNGRFEVTREDYDLAGLVWETSCAVRDRARAEMNDKKRRDEDRAADKVVRLEARKEVARQQSSGEARSLADFLVAKIIQNGEMSRSNLRKAVTPKKRDMFDEALNTAVLAGELVEADGRINLRIAEAS